MTMITPSYLGETIEYSSLHACRSTLEDPTSRDFLVCSRCILLGERNRSHRDKYQYSDGFKNGSKHSRDIPYFKSTLLQKDFPCDVE